MPLDAAAAAAMDTAYDSEDHNVGLDGRFEHEKIMTNLPSDIVKP